MTLVEVEGLHTVGHTLMNWHLLEIYSPLLLHVFHKILLILNSMDSYSYKDYNSPLEGLCSHCYNNVL